MLVHVFLQSSDKQVESDTKRGFGFIDANYPRSDTDLHLKLSTVRDERGPDLTFLRYALNGGRTTRLLVGLKRPRQKAGLSPCVVFADPGVAGADCPLRRHGRSVQELIF